MLEVVGVVLATASVAILLVHSLYPALWRDIYTIYVSLGVIRRVKKSYSRHELIIDQFEKQVRHRPHHTFILFKEERYTYEQVDKQATKVARALMQLDVTHVDTIALIMANEPAIIWIYLGAQKIGARLAQINHHLKSEGLQHSINSCAPKILIVGDEEDEDLPARVGDLKLGQSVSLYSYRTTTVAAVPSFLELMNQVSGEQIPASVRSPIQLSDPCAFIFTSGTTGLPKPAIITHKKAILCSHCFGPVGFSSREVLYLTLPLYHASSLNLALLNVISAGATLALREKFSVRNFWSDCVKYEATCFQYIGEMLRYLVHSPELADEKRHKVWAAIGNGLRKDIWVKFKSRFRISNIYEFYGSTELPVGINNLFNVTGSVGRLSPLLSSLTKVVLVKFNPETNRLYRNSDGCCELVQPGESGILLARLSEKVTFDGYLGPAAETNSRIIKDVLEIGDFYVNTNDVFTIDEQYNLYFKDRIDDSFRWKGENVSAAEVSNAMNCADFVEDTNVFGVTVPGCEGKAGMAAISLKNGEELNDEKIEELERLCKLKLPGYARPRFLRFQRQMSLTSTFKQQKTELVKEGFNPHVVDEPLYYLDRANDHFRPLDDQTFEDIIQGNIAL